MEKNHPLNAIMATTIAKVRELAETNTIIGEPIKAGEMTLIPISKVSLGFGTGGSEFSSKNQLPSQDPSFGGGGGAGLKITPVAFLCVSGTDVKLLPMTGNSETTLDKIIDMVPEVVSKISEFFDKGESFEDFEEMEFDLPGGIEVEIRKDDAATEE